MKLALEPLNPTVGDLAGNRALIEGAIRRAAAAGADLLVLPELVTTGYPPRDLLLQSGFIDDVRASVEAIARVVPAGLTVLIGTPWREPDAPGGALLTNSVVVAQAGRITERYDKRLLPNYDVFDELRYFRPGTRAVTIEVAGVRVGLAVCEDLWRGVDAHTDDRYADSPDPLAELAAAGVQLIAVPSASPFVRGKSVLQGRIIAQQCERLGIAIASVNQCGANDDLIFDGHSAIYTPGPFGAMLTATGRPFETGSVMADFDPEAEPVPVETDPFEAADPAGLLWDALVLGVRDYARKSGFGKITLGVSGGIDSALCAVLGAAAVGAENLIGIAMPSRYSSQGSLTDAEELCRNLGCVHEVRPIEGAHAVLEQDLGEVLRALGVEGGATGLTAENIQSRIRGLTMMAVSNATGALLLTTGNKCEHATGYSTLYGDQNGGLAPIADLLKGEVYELCRWINANHERGGFNGAPIPESTITKPPSAELRPDQKDSDSLPDYAVLDEIVERYVDGREDARTIEADLVSRGAIDRDELRRVIRLIDLNEYKRFQLAIALKVRPVAFGRGRRRAIVQGYGVLG
ncbi:MAG: NAD+ synthase [Phycisphaerales bacterium]